VATIPEIMRGIPLFRPFQFKTGFRHEQGGGPDRNLSDLTKIQDLIAGQPEVGNFVPDASQKRSEPTEFATFGRARMTGRPARGVVFASGGSTMPDD
jgi:hypothetical protein